jgi:hypothetical protein
MIIGGFSSPVAVAKISMPILGSVLRLFGGIIDVLVMRTKFRSVKLDAIGEQRRVSYLALSSNRLANSSVTDSKYAFRESCGKDKLYGTIAVNIVFAELGAEAIINKPSNYID